jgi:hypothetical protein
LSSRQKRIKRRRSLFIDARCRKCDNARATKSTLHATGREKEREREIEGEKRERARERKKRDRERKNDVKISFWDHCTL